MANYTFDLQITPEQMCLILKWKARDHENENQGDKKVLTAFQELL